MRPPPPADVELHAASDRSITLSWDPSPVPGVPAGNGTVFYARDALLDGFDWFQLLTGWFPQVLPSAASLSPGHLVVDMAYSSRGTLTFNNVVVPTTGLYTVD